jgi:hypothetical protein
LKEESKVTKRLAAILAAGVIVLVVGVAVGVWAFTQATQDVPSGQFTTDAETVAILVETYRASDGVKVTDGSWLTGASLEPGDHLFGAVKVTNQTTSAAVAYGMRTLNIDNSDGKGLASRLFLHIVRPNDQSSPTICGSDGVFDGVAKVDLLDVKLSLAPAFGDPAPGPQTGDRSLAGGATELLCFRMSYGNTEPQVFGASTGATFSFHADDAP